MTSTKTNILLQEIQKCVRCAYLSDLHCITFSPKAKSLLNDIPENCFTIEEWNDAASYILQRICCLTTIQEIKNEIIANK